MIYERHHVRPISLYWPDHNANIMRIRKNTHKEIHDILNIPWNHIRKIRSQVNDKRIFNEHDLSCIHKLQRMYFSNIDLLNIEALKIHDKNFSNQISRRKNQINIINKKIWDEEIHLNKWDLNILKDWSHRDIVDSTRHKLSLLFQLEKQKLIQWEKYLAYKYMKNNGVW